MEISTIIGLILGLVALRITSYNVCYTKLLRLYRKIALKKKGNSVDKKDKPFP